jgi:hypothetical protein
MAIEPSDWKLSSSVSIASSRAIEAAATGPWRNGRITGWPERRTGDDEAVTPASETISSSVI